MAAKFTRPRNLCHGNAVSTWQSVQRLRGAAIQQPDHRLARSNTANCPFRKEMSVLRTQRSSWEMSELGISQAGCPGWLADGVLMDEAAK